MYQKVNYNQVEEGTECFICYMEFEEDSKILKTKCCKHEIHEACKQGIKNKDQCVYCRSFDKTIAMLNARDQERYGEYFRELEEQHARNAELYFSEEQERIYLEHELMMRGIDDDDEFDSDDIDYDLMWELHA